VAAPHWAGAEWEACVEVYLAAAPPLAPRHPELAYAVQVTTRGGVRGCACAGRGAVWGHDATAPLDSRGPKHRVFLGWVCCLAL
jgi:hypothetical protein